MVFLMRMSFALRILMLGALLALAAFFGLLPS
jgi:hypothetical protein